VVLKERHLSHSSNIPTKLDSLKARLSWFDDKGGDQVLYAPEIEEMCEVAIIVASKGDLNCDPF